MGGCGAHPSAPRSHPVSTPFAWGVRTPFAPRQHPVRTILSVEHWSLVLHFGGITHLGRSDAGARARAGLDRHADGAAGLKEALLRGDDDVLVVAAPAGPLADG